MLVDIGPAPDRPSGMFLSGYENVDLAFPAVAGRRSRWLQVATRLVDWALTASETDPVVAVRFFRVNSLIDSPLLLLHPIFVCRAAVVTLRRRRGAGQRRQAVPGQPSTLG